MFGPPSLEITSLIFNDQDKSLAASSKSGYIGVWSLPSYQLIYDNSIDTVV